jgi:fructokinase
LTPLIFGEVLVDRFPDGHQVLGGAPFNVAWNLQALGAAPRLISSVGDDDPGRRIRAAMRDWGLDTTALTTDSDHATGTVEVTFVDGQPRYEITADRAWDHIAPPPVPVTAGGLLYHGSLALRSPGSRRTLAGLRAAAGDSIFVDVNLRDPWWDRGTVLDTLQGARWAKLNADELALLAPGHGDPDTRAEDLLADRALEALIVTLGGDGARVLTAGGERIARPVAAVGDVVDTVGAGDAFSAVTLLGLLRGWDWPTILDRAQHLAGAVVGLRGATTTDTTFYRSITDAWERA